MAILARIDPSPNLSIVFVFFSLIRAREEAPTIGKGRNATIASHVVPNLWTLVVALMEDGFRVKNLTRTATTRHNMAAIVTTKLTGNAIEIGFDQPKRGCCALTSRCANMRLARNSKTMPA